MAPALTTARTGARSRHKARGRRGLTSNPRRPQVVGVCPYFHEAVELVGKRWNGAIVHTLLSGPMRFSALAHAIPQISDRLLSMRLRELEAPGSSRGRSATARPCGSSTS